jgi:hypothetical protein
MRIKKGSRVKHKATGRVGFVFGGITRDGCDVDWGPGEPPAGLVGTGIVIRSRMENHHAPIAVALEPLHPLFSGARP